ncbi:Crinkler effector protein 108 [Phytophthora ramorum]|uniref:Crinkler effector protein 108 n=1 Tax=Phytophthora ramorum TaxID=164328 RepID=UPI0030B57FA1|nr:Crinkler effector protein 108 [Phytophthora ramorum]KAH7496068.1 Crinkler effector protein 108 [Phytophthora ramorum]
MPFTARFLASGPIFFTTIKCTHSTTSAFVHRCVQRPLPTLATTTAARSTKATENDERPAMSPAINWDSFLEVFLSFQNLPPRGNMVKLFCTIASVPGSVFPVDIDERLTVAVLKDAIEAKMAADFKNIDAPSLQLYDSIRGICKSNNISDEVVLAEAREVGDRHQLDNIVDNGEKYGYELKTTLLEKAAFLLQWNKQIIIDSIFIATRCSWRIFVPRLHAMHADVYEVKKYPMIHVLFSDTYTEYETERCA